MKPLENVWRSLVQRRLLPVAILLLAAIAATPFVLARDPEPVAPAPVVPSAASGAKDDTRAQPVVSLSDESTPAQRRRVLGAVKNPFRPARAPKAEATAAPSTTSTSSAGTTAPSSSSTSGGSVAGSGATSPASPGSGSVTKPSEPVATAPAPATKAPSTQRTYSVYSAVVRYGNPDEGEPEQKSLTRLTPLPDAKSPAVVYLGVGLDNGDKAAYFLVGDTVELEDEAQCRPSPRDCQGIALAVGKKAVLKVVDENSGEVTGRYEVEVVKLKRKVVTDPAEAEKARAESSKAGRRVVRSHQAAYGPLRYRYDTRSGTVRKISKRADFASRAL
jgi:hypothetical protein